MSPQRWLLGVWLLLLTAAVSAQVEIPRLTQRVTDVTGTLSAAQTQALESKLAVFEADKGSQIAVLIVATTQPEDIAQFGIRVADAWKIGRENVDDGVILIVAKDDRRLRLEVGYGLEGVIPDAIAKRVISEIIKPYFKNGDFAGGINAGVDRLIKLIEGEPLPPPKQTTGKPPNLDGFMMILAIGLAVGAVLVKLLGRTAGGLLAGIGSGLVAVLFGMGFMALLLVILVFFMIIAHGRGGSGWTGGGGSWGGGSSWGGGGGGFGGGGASDSW